MEIVPSLEAEQQMQKRTFTNWINFRLEEHSSSGRVSDLFVDMRDGVLLCHLLEVLTGEVLLVSTQSAIVPISGDGRMNGKPKKRQFSDDSKRVYYFANLAAALKCLRGNGLHLVSNNVTDLANGNPHVWLGLVWQIILHFQVEKDLTLLRQSAWHQIHQQHLQLGQKCRDSYLSSPSTSNGGFASPTPGGKKEEVERQLIRWVNEEVIGDLGLRINDLDRSWCDGRLFSALVHRFAPALMPRGVILGGGNDSKSAQLKAERAMEMARIHLGIRPLLDPRDLSASEYVPDKRSIVAYISQFARLPQRQINHPEKIVGAQIALERQEKVTSEAEEPLEKVVRECLDWLNSVVGDERLTFVQGQRMSLRHYIWFTQMREEFWERRTLIVDHLLVAIKKSQSEGLGKRVEREIGQLELAINEWERHFLTYFAGIDLNELAALSNWISLGERLLSNAVPDQLESSQVDETLRRLENAIGRVEKFFHVLSDQRALLYDLEQQIGSESPFESLSPESLLQPMHLLGDLRRRFDSLAERQRNAMAEMLFEQCRFRALEQLGILKSKIRIWKTQLNSAEQTRNTLAEWTEFAANERPKDLCEQTIDSLEKAIPRDLHGRELQTYSQLSKEFHREIDRFYAFGDLLQRSVDLWTKFELIEGQLLSLALGPDEWTAKINECEELAAEIGATGAEMAEKAARRISELRRLKGTEVAGDQMDLANSNHLNQLEKDSAEAAECSEVIRDAEFWKWQIIGEELAQKRPKTGEELNNLIDWLEDLERDFPCAEASLKRWVKASTDERDRRIESFQSVHRRFLAQLESLRSLRRRFVHLEKILTDLEQWTVHSDPGCSEMASKSIGERARLVHWSVTELSELASLCPKETFDLSLLIALAQSVRRSFTDMEQCNEEEEQIGRESIRRSIAADLELLQIASTSKALSPSEQRLEAAEGSAEKAGVTLERLNSLRTRLERAEMDAARVGPSSTQKVDLWALLKRKRAVLAREETCEEEARASLHEMALIGAELGDELKGNAEFDKLSAEWTRKKAELERHLLLNDKLKSLCLRLNEERAELGELDADLDEFGRMLSTASGIPLHRHLIQRAGTIRKRIHRKTVEKLRQQRHSLQRKIDSLKKSPAGDLLVAIEVAEEVLQEVSALVQQSISAQQIVDEPVDYDGGEQYPDPSLSCSTSHSSAELLRLTSEAKQLQKALGEKMELLNRLERLEKTLEEICRDNGGWDVVLSPQIEAVLGVLANWLKQFSDELAPELGHLDGIFSQIEGNFMQAELEGMKRRLGRTREQIVGLKQLMEHRQIFLIKLCAFKALVEKCSRIEIESVQNESIPANEAQKLEQLELNSLKKQILESVPELFECQTKAQISVPDVDVQQMISDLLVGNGDGRSPSASSSCSNALNHFLKLSSELQCSLERPVERFDPAEFSPGQFLERITQSIASEEGSLNELEQLSSSNSLAPFPPQSNNAIETVRLLNERFQKRRIDQQNRIEELFSRCLREFRDGLSALEAQLGNSIERKDVETMELLQRIEYAELRKKLELFNDSLRKLPSVTETAYWKRKWVKRFQQLQSNLNIFGENLMSAKIAVEEREGRKEQKMLHNLSSFGKWLHLVESEVLQLHSFCQSADFELDQNERRVKLTKLRDNCVQHFRLVVKLQTHQFASEEQAELAKRLCQQYRKVMEQFEKMQLPISHLIPVKKANEKEMLNAAAGGVSTRAQSQLSLDSSTPSDLDSDLASIHSEVLVAEALSHLCQPSTSSASSESSLIHQLSTTKIDSKLNELPMDQIEREVQQLLLAIDHLHARYYTPKPLGEAQQDAASLKLLAKQLTELKADLNKIAEMASNDNKKQLQKVLSNLKREKNGLKRFHRALTDEVEDEIELRTNYAQTAEYLSDLDNEIRSAASEGRVPQTSAVLPRIELQIEMLKKQCRATRKYVEMSVDGSTATSPTRRKRIIFKLSNSVTTIIQVIENKLRQEEEAAKKKHRKDKSESETELSNLHKKLTALKRETESEMEVADSDEDGSPRGHESVSKKVQSIVVRRSTTISVEEASSSSKMLDEQQQQTKTTSERENGISVFLQQVQQMVQKSELVRQKLEELISTGGEVPEAGQHHGPLIQKVRSELDELLSELNGIKMEENSSVVVLNCKDKLTHLVEAFGVLDSNYQQKMEQQKAFRQMLDEQNRKMNKAISDGERLLMDPEATLEQFQSAIDDLDKVDADIHSAIVRSNPPTFVSNELKKGLGHLNAIKQRLVREHSLSMETKMAVAEGVEKLRRLRQQKDEVAALLKNGGAAEAFGVVKEMEIYGRNLKLVADKLKTLEVELPIIAEIDEHLRLIEATKKEIRKRMDKDQTEELQKSKWPERVTEVFLDVMLVRTETEDIENECIKKVVLNIPKRRTWNDEAASKKDQLREQTARFNESLVALVRQAHEKLDEPAAMPQSYEQLANGLDEPIEHAEQFVTENAAAVDEQAATLISSNIAEAKEVRGRLVQRWQHWLQFVRQRELGTAQLDKARVAIELAEQKACRSLPDAESDYENLMEAQSSLTSLNATIDQLQQLADKLDPLAMAYAEVRFLDVDFEQLEKHYGDVLGQMHNEIEHERALMAEIERTDRETDDLAAQLPSMDTNLKALQHVQQTTIPSLEAKIVMLEQQSQQQKPLRKYVLRSTADASPDGLAQRVEQSKTQAQEAAQQLVDRSVARIRTVLVQSPAASEQLPSDQRIDECAKELEEDIPLEHPLNNELRQQLEQLRGKVKRRDAIQSQIDERLTTIGKELEEFSDQFDSRKMPSKKEDKRAKKKGKRAAADSEQHQQQQQQQQCAAEKVPREEQINELRKALERLENGIVPTLSSLQDEAVREGIPLQPTEEQQHQLVLANQIVQSLKTDLDKRVAENERASAVINEIRVLRSLVEGMVVEQTAEEASLQLNLESVSQQQKDVEEAAKTLGEQLGKVAAKSQEISSNSLHPEEQALMKESEEEASRKMERLNSLNTVLQQQIELLRAWARDKDSLELRTSSLIDDFKKVEEKRPQEGQVTAAAAEEELAKLDALKSGVGEARDEMMRMQCWLVQKLPKCGRAQIELQLQPVEDSLVQLNTDLSGTMQQLNKCVEFEHNLLEERTALLNALDHLNEQVQLARAIEDPHDQSSELDRLQNELEHIEQQMRNLENKSVDPTQTTSQIAHSVNITMTSIADARHQLEARIAQKARDEHLREQTARFNESLVSEGPSTQRQTTEEPQYDVDAAAEILSAIYAGREPREVIREHGLDKLELDLDDDYGDGETEGRLEAESSLQPPRPSTSSDINSSTSPIPEDPKHAEEQHSPQKAMAQRQHSRWRRVLRTALPLQAMLVLLLGAACLVPHCDDEYCCHLLNNFARSFDTQLDFINGPPPF